ncbi:MAG: AAA family ATPase [Nitrospinae bacterium]|nr:AAA family ATPase [Nitrospinota bacterium]
MTFEELLDQAMAMLERRGRVTYRALKRQFNLDDDYLEDLKAELIEAQQVAIDEGGIVLVWTGGPASAAMPTEDQARAPRSYTPPYLAEQILASRSTLEGERKQVTVLFADLKGSMELLADRDPEEARAVLDPVLERMMEAVHRYEGTVNQVLGDGIMALFGAPIAHEDHAVRACYAALAMQQTIRRYSEQVRRTHGMTILIRVGLNSGEVVVRAIGNDLHMDYSAIGQTTHLAARMEQLASPGSVLLTAETRRLAEGFIHVDPLGPVPVKGLTEPVEVFELAAATAVRRRLQATAARGLTRFVGRHTELEALGHALERAGAGHGQVAAIVGEPGVGKSRLVYELLQSHRSRGCLALESFSVSYGKATPYFPVIELFKRFFGIEEQDEPRAIRAKVTGHVLTLDEALQDTIPAFLSLLEVLPEESPFRTLAPSQRRERTLEGLKRVLLRESQVQPLLLVFEDLQWIDAETQALLDSLVESLPTARIFLLVNYRPEYRHEWGSKTYYAQLRLDPLPPESADELLRALLGDNGGLATLKSLLIQRTEGNPFFLEESVRTLVETQVLVGERGSYRLGQSLPSIQVPATVQAVLAARIDRLPAEEKGLLQTSAVIGTDVPLRLLQAIAALSEEALRRGLMHLQAAEFLYETRLFPELEYTFKHALTHEVAYGTLLQERRKALHARIVDALEALYPDSVGEQVERLAHHALRGEVWEKAVGYFRQAGAKAASRSANREAVTYCEQALLALQHLPERPETLEQAIDLRFELRNVLVPLGEFGRIPEHLRAAETLAQALGDQGRLGRVSDYMSAHFMREGEHDRAIESGRRALALGTALGDLALQVETNHRLGQIYHSLGDYRQAMDFLRTIIVALEGELLRERFGMPGLPSVSSRSMFAWCLAEVGAFDEGMTSVKEAVQVAEAADHPYSRVAAYLGVGMVSLRKGELHQATPVLEHGLGLCQAGNIPIMFLQVATLLAYAYALAGRIVEAVLLLEQVDAESLLAYHRMWAAWLAEAYLLAGRGEDALQLARCTLERTQRHKERGGQAYAFRLLGEIAAQHDPPEVELAENHYRQALALADALGMRPLVAHCHLGLGKLYHETGRLEQARVELSGAIELFRAMEMPFWLARAEGELARAEDHL